MEMSIKRPVEATNSSYKLQDKPICKILKLPSYKLQIFWADRFYGVTFSTRFFIVKKYSFFSKSTFSLIFHFVLSCLGKKPQIKFWYDEYI